MSHGITTVQPTGQDNEGAFWSGNKLCIDVDCFIKLLQHASYTELMSNHNQDLNSIDAKSLKQNNLPITSMFLYAMEKLMPGGVVAHKIITTQTNRYSKIETNDDNDTRKVLDSIVKEKNSDAHVDNKEKDIEAVNWSALSAKYFASMLNAKKDKNFNKQLNKENFDNLKKMFNSETAHAFSTCTEDGLKPLLEAISFLIEKDQLCLYKSNDKKILYDCEALKGIKVDNNRIDFDIRNGRGDHSGLYYLNKCPQEYQYSTTLKPTKELKGLISENHFKNIIKGEESEQQSTCYDIGKEVGSAARYARDTAYGAPGRVAQTLRSILSGLMNGVLCAAAAECGKGCQEEYNNKDTQTTRHQKTSHTQTTHF